MENLYNKYYFKSIDLSKITYLTIDFTNEELITKLPLMTNLKNLFLEISSLLDISVSVIKTLKNLNLTNLEIKGVCSLDEQIKSNKLDVQNKNLYSIQEEELSPEIEIKTKKLYNPYENKLLDLLSNLPASLTLLEFECVELNYDDLINAIDKLPKQKTFTFVAVECGLSSHQVEKINKLIKKLI